MSTTTINLAWLAGFVDGEGYLGLISRGTRYVTQVSIANTNLTVMKKVSEILMEMAINHSLTTTDKNNLKNGKKYHIVQINRFESIATLLAELMPYLVAKKQEAHVLYEYCMRRMRSKFRAPYTEEDLKSYAILKLLKGWRPKTKGE